MMPGVDAECPLMRPLLAGEYVLAVDAETNQRLKIPTAVIDPTPHALTLYYFDGMMSLHWNAVPGAEYYTVYSTIGGMEIPLFDTPDTQAMLPLPLEARGFFRVTAHH